MKEADRLIRDIETLKESINLNWKDLSRMDLSAAEKRGIKKHIKWCVHHLNCLLIQLEHGEETNE